MLCAHKLAPKAIQANIMKKTKNTVAFRLCFPYSSVVLSNFLILLYCKYQSIANKIAQYMGNSHITNLNTLNTTKSGIRNNATNFHLLHYFITCILLQLFSIGGGDGN